MAEITVVLVGDTDRAEFREACASLEALGDTTTVPDLDAAAERLIDAPLPPDLIVLAQSRPGEFSSPGVDRLRALAPLARMVALLGSWCEGETRSGRPLPGVIRIYWHQWLPRLAQELDRIRCGRCPTWGLPATAGDDERLLLGSPPRLARHGLVAIHARRFEAADWLSAACRLGGYATVWLPPGWRTRVEGAAALVFDGSDFSGREPAELRRAGAELGPLPIVVLLDFPRAADRDRARAAGAAAVLSKPLLVDDLLWQLEAVSDLPRST
jgi:hypothetical protein